MSSELRKQNHKNGAIKSVWLDFCEQKCILIENSKYL